MSYTEVSAIALRSDAGPDTILTEVTEIAGYRMLERIGMGGFGEVWRAVGPGDFPKAARFCSDSWIVFRLIPNSSR